MTCFAGRLSTLSCHAAALLLLAANNVSAGTSTSTFTASVTIAASCTVSATNLAFGTYLASSATPLTGTSTVNVYCTSGTPYTLALNVGSGGGTFAARDMASGANLMTYNLYTSAAHTDIWGDGTASTSMVAGTGAGVLTSSPNTVYGNIPISQDLPPGTYTSTITVTVNY